VVGEPEYAFDFTFTDSGKDDSMDAGERSRTSS
jgi:hypothetical protein